MAGEVIEEMAEAGGIVRGEVEASITSAGEVEAHQIGAGEVEYIKGALQGIGALEAYGVAAVDVPNHESSGMRYSLRLLPASRTALPLTGAVKVMVYSPVPVMTRLWTVRVETPPLIFRIV